MNSEQLAITIKQSECLKWFNCTLPHFGMALSSNSSWTYGFTVCKLKKFQCKKYGEQMKKYIIIHSFKTENRFHVKQPTLLTAQGTQWTSLQKILNKKQEPGIKKFTLKDT